MRNDQKRGLGSAPMQSPAAGPRVPKATSARSDKRASTMAHATWHRLAVETASRREQVRSFSAKGELSCRVATARPRRRRSLGWAAAVGRSVVVGQWVVIVILSNRSSRSTFGGCRAGSRPTLAAARTPLSGGVFTRPAAAAALVLARFVARAAARQTARLSSPAGKRSCIGWLAAPEPMPLDVLRQRRAEVTIGLGEGEVGHILAKDVDGLLPNTQRLA